MELTIKQAIEELKAILEMQYENVPLSKAALEMAIKALEQEPSGDDVVSRDVVKEQMIMYGFHAPDMTVTEFVKDLPPVNLKEPTAKNDLGVDAVSRQEVLYLIADHDLSMGQVVRGIHALPSVTPQEPRWISVKDRLPKKGEYGDVLVTFIPTAGILWATVMIARYSDLMGIAKPCFHIGEVGKKSFENITPQVIAWQPLPKPYEPQESEDKE